MKVILIHFLFFFSYFKFFPTHHFKILILALLKNCILNINYQCLLKKCNGLMWVSTSASKKIAFSNDNSTKWIDLICHAHSSINSQLIKSQKCIKDFRSLNSVQLKLNTIFFSLIQSNPISLSTQSTWDSMPCDLNTNQREFNLRLPNKENITMEFKFELSRVNRFKLITISIFWAKTIIRLSVVS